MGLAPEAAGPHYIRALMFHSVDWNMFANRSYRRALALDREHKEALSGLARVAATQGRLAAAAGRISAVLAAEPTNHTARTELDRVVIGGVGGWAIMSVWMAGFIGMFVMALLPPSAMPLPEIVAAPAVLATCAGLVAWLGWLLYAGGRGLARLVRKSRQDSSHHL